MQPSRPLYVGWDAHTGSIAVAYIAPEYHAEVVSLGTIGPHQCDSDQRMRQLQSKTSPLVFVSEAGPCGAWLYRSLTTTGHRCWVVAPAGRPQKAGDRVTTARRDALPLARLWPCWRG